MKPLTIDELKSLEVGDWVWVETFDKHFYYKILVPSVDEMVFSYRHYTGVMKYSDYGKTWLAYKNKEQAEEEQCAICHRDISDELPKVDVDSKRYCHQCYEDKCKGETRRMKGRYYEADGTMNKEVFVKKLAEQHKQVDGADLKGLLSIRNKLYALKRKYEECGRRFLECEYEIMALNEIIEEERKRRTSNE